MTALSISLLDLGNNSIEPRGIILEERVFTTLFSEDWELIT